MRTECAVLLWLILAWGGTPARGDEGLVAHWALDEVGASSVADRSGNGNDIPLVGPLATYRIQPVVCGPGKRALLFSVHPLHGALRVAAPSAEGFSVAAWIHPVGFGRAGNAYRNILSIKSADGKDVFRFTVRGNGGLFATVATEPPTWCTSPWGSLATNTWQHVAFTYDHKTLRRFVNGRELTRRDVAGASSPRLPPNGALQLGGAARGFAWAPALGTDVAISDCRLYNRALRAEEIVALHGAAVTSYAPTAAREVPVEPFTLTVATYNVFQYKGRHLKGKGEGDQVDFWTGRGRDEAITFFSQALASLEADILLLQEAAYPWMSAALAEKLGMHYMPKDFSPEAYRDGKSMNSGVVLSRYPIVEYRDYAQFSLAGQPGQTRAFARATVVVPSVGKVTFYNAHLWPYAPDSGRIEQTHIFRIVDEERQLGVPQFLAGDFNRRSDSFFLSRLESDRWRNVVRETGAHIPGSWNVDRSYANIDWILVRGADDWTLARSEVVRNNWTVGTEGAAFVASDHLPVRAVFQFGRKPE